MGSTQPIQDEYYLHEVWILFGIGMLALAARFFVRIRTGGFRGFQGDDYISLWMVVCHILDATAVTMIYFHGANTDFTPDRVATFTYEEIEHIELGSKIEFIAWNTYTMLL